MVTTAYVNLWNQRIGAVVWNEADGIAAFEYAPGFTATDLEVAPLMMPRTAGRIFTFPEHRNNRTFKGLPGLLADALPDRYGNALINQWLLRKGRPTNSIHPVETLCFIGNRGMGALEFEPAIPAASRRSEKLALEEVIRITSNILSGRQAFIERLSHDQEKAMQAILKVGTSAGGARAKAVIAYNQQTQEVRSGQGTIPEGFEHCLIKFDGIEDEQLGTSHGYGRVEMAYYKMALDSGIEMMESELLEENGRAHFLTRRFDRTAGAEKRHVQSFCALRHWDFQDIHMYSYEGMFETMRLLGLPYPQAEQLYRRMAFNVMARNCDDHTKNFACVMDPDGTWSLSPAFDVCHAFRPSSSWVSQHCLSVNGKRTGIDRADLLQVAKHVHIKGANDLLDQIDQAVGRWTDYAAAQDVEPTLQRAIGATHVRMA